MSALEPHYSDLTLQALIEHHGWERGYSLGPSGELSSVSRTFVGVGPLGGTAVPDGARRLYAGYDTDAERRRYIALALGDRRIVDLDGRDDWPAAIARLINLKAEQFADEKRVANGLNPLYAVGSPAIALQAGAPGKLREAASLVAQYDLVRHAGRAPASVVPPLQDDDAGPYRLLRARDIRPGDEVLFDVPRTGSYRVEDVETDALGQVRHRFRDGTGSSSYAPQEFLRVAEAPGLEARVTQGWERHLANVKSEPPVPDAADELEGPRP